jgi:hypothetical protein
MRSRVHSFLLIAVLAAVAGAAGADGPPPGLVRWGEQSYRLEPGEATSFRVDSDQIPVRRWVLLVESDRAPSHLNVRRVHDGSLLFDQRGEIRHEVDVPWGEGESLSAVLTAAGRGGVFSVSIWGPPRDDYLRSHGYEVNRALEAMAAGERERVRHHLLVALRERPDDAVARVLLEALESGVLPAPGGLDSLTVDGPAETDPDLVATVVRGRERIAALRAAGRSFAALEAVQRELGREVGDSLRAELLGDLTGVLVDLDNLQQAREALDRAAALGLPAARVDALEQLLDDGS